MKLDRFEEAKPTELIDFKIGVDTKLSVEKRLIGGNIEEDVLLEVIQGNKFYNKQCDLVLANGGRVFRTYNKGFIYVHSEKSLQLLQEKLAV